MFKGMNPIFWAGLAIMYGLTFTFMIVEMANPGFTYNVKIAGVPAIFFYLLIFMNFVVNVVIAWAWYYFPEQEDKRREQMAKQSGVSAGGS